MREIVDPHHHLWPADFLGGLLGPYTADELHTDTDTVPDVVQTVFVECGAAYRSEGPEHLAPVGETEFVAAQAAATDASSGATIAGIVRLVILGAEPIGTLVNVGWIAYDLIAMSVLVSALRYRGFTHQKEHQ